MARLDFLFTPLENADFDVCGGPARPEPPPAPEAVPAEPKPPAENAAKG